MDLNYITTHKITLDFARCSIASATALEFHVSETDSIILDTIAAGEKQFSTPVFLVGDASDETLEKEFFIRQSKERNKIFFEGKTPISISFTEKEIESLENLFLENYFIAHNVHLMSNGVRTTLGELDENSFEVVKKVFKEWGVKLVLPVMGEESSLEKITKELAKKAEIVAKNKYVGTPTTPFFQKAERIKKDVKKGLLISSQIFLLTKLLDLLLSKSNKWYLQLLRVVAIGVTKIATAACVYFTHTALSEIYESAGSQHE